MQGCQWVPGRHLEWHHTHDGYLNHGHAGAMDAGMPVGGIRISREAGTTVRTASYLPIDCAVFCRFLSSRKVPRPA